VPELIINGDTIKTMAEGETPLLYVLTDELQLQSVRYGCGMAQCGSCSVLVDGVEIRSCITPISTLEGKAITTLEGLTAYYAAKSGTQKKQTTPLQDALIEEQAIQCGYCINGMVIKGTELLLNNPNPSETEIRQAMNGHLCRCGTYPKIISAIQKAAARTVAVNAMTGKEELV
jgi:aerobic-type carbon monoxide dehydrogenase small subunit (CoxS/CutS family)